MKDKGFIQSAAPAEINNPDSTEIVHVFRNTDDNMYYGKLSNGAIELIGGAGASLWEAGTATGSIQQPNAGNANANDGDFSVIVGGGNTILGEAQAIDNFVAGTGITIDGTIGNGAQANIVSGVLNTVTSTAGQGANSNIVSGVLNTINGGSGNLVQGNGITLDNVGAAEMSASAVVGANITCTVSDAFEGNAIFGEDHTITSGEGPTPVTGILVSGHDHLIEGVSQASVRGLEGALDEAFRDNWDVIAAGMIADHGDAQTMQTVVKAVTSDDTPTLMTVNGQRLGIETNTSWIMEVSLVAVEGDNSNTHVYSNKAGIKSDNGGGVSIVYEIGEDQGGDIVGASVDLVVSGAPNDIHIQVTGVAATNIRWVANVKATKVNGFANP